MKPIVYTLLFIACIGQVGAQQNKPGESASPARRTATEQPAVGSGTIPCPRCNREEQLVVDLVYYKQVLDILEEINQQRDRIDASLLKSVHAELIKIRPDLASLLKTRAEPAARH